MTCDDLLAILGDREVTLFLDGSRIGYRGPREGVTTALLRAIARHKASLVERLGGTPVSPPAAVERTEQTQPRREPARVETEILIGCPVPRLLVRGPGVDGFCDCNRIPSAATEYRQPLAGKWGDWKPIPSRWRPIECNTRS